MNNFRKLPVVSWAALTTTSAFAAEYPDKPIRIVVPFMPGGSNDLVGRVLAQKFTESWGQPVVIDNRAGGGSTIGIKMVVRAAPDGYTLLVTSGGIAIDVTLCRLPFNPVRDLAPVARLAQMPYVLAVHPSLPVKSTLELINLAKVQPEKWCAPPTLVDEKHDAQAKRGCAVVCPRAVAPQI
jgi:tripartite-type tricarboxylate transporter receptor subunit TctC